MEVSDRSLSNLKRFGIIEDEVVVSVKREPKPEPEEYREYQEQLWTQQDEDSTGEESDHSDLRIDELDDTITVKDEIEELALREYKQWDRHYHEPQPDTDCSPYLIQTSPQPVYPDVKVTLCIKYKDRSPTTSKIHTRNKKFKCDFCGEQFSNKDYLNDHTKTHCEIEDYRYEPCNIKFDSDGQLQCRSRNAHRVINENFNQNKQSEVLFNIRKILTHLNTSIEEYDNYSLNKNTYTESISNCSEEEYASRTPLHFKTVHEKIYSECNLCCRTFVNESSLQMHYERHDSMTDFVCTYCDKRFIANTHFQDHVQTHIGKNVFQCNVCDAKYDNKKRLLQHMKTHDKKTLNCELCNIRFATNTQLKSHLRTHSGKLESECDICGRKFITMLTLQEHRKKHRTKTDFKCRHCKKRFIINAHLEQHLKTHEIIDNISECNYFPKKFKTNVGLQKNVLKHNPKSDIKGADCKKEYIVDEDSKQRLQTPGIIENIPECSYCSKKIKTKVSLQNHILKHNPETDFKCTDCDKRFIAYSRLQSHLKTHLETKHLKRDLKGQEINFDLQQKKLNVFKCNCCNEQFFESKQFRKHIRKHIERSNLECIICCMRYSNVGSLQKHILIHDEKTDFKCNQCTKRYIVSTQLKRHLTMHEQEQDFLRVSVRNNKKLIIQEE